ncbi:MAG: choice-of-anchor A family protein [Ignavibacterium sp.]|nr:choice-of-anchor A family protein [Ignavibacterium sp.]
MENTIRKKIQLVISILVLFASIINGFTGGSPNSPEGFSNAKVFGTNVGANVSFTNPYNPSQTMNVFAGTFRGEIDGNNANFFCVDIRNPLAIWTAQNPHIYTDTSYTPSQITYILNNYYPHKTYPYPGALSTANNEAAAVQLAIWHFADGVNLNTVTNATLRNRAIQIVNDANANHNNMTPPATLVLMPAIHNLPWGANASFNVLAYDLNGNPLANRTVNVSVSSGTLNFNSLVTNSSGVAGPFIVTQGSSSSANIIATATTIIPQGTRYVHRTSPNSYQKLVLATPTVATSTAYGSITWLPNADLRITKTVSNPNPQHNQQISFTITVYNDGPSTANNVKVSEILNAAFVYVSSNATVGSYNPSTGIWNIGTLPANSSATLTINVTVDFQLLTTNSLNFGVAKDFNLFVLEDLFQPSSDTEGKVAVGRNAFFANYSIGDRLPNSNGTEDVLIVGKNLTFLSGRVYNGNVVYGDTTNLPISTVSILEGSLRKDNVINFNAAASYLNGLSNSLAAFQPNGTVNLQWGGIFMNGNNPFVNVFNISGSDLSSANNVEIRTPAGAVAIVNISGTNISWSGGLSLFGTDKQNVIFNFYQADSLKIQNIAVLGSILAPKTHVNFVSGVQEGQMICKSLVGMGQFNLANFIGNIPADTTIYNIVEIISSDKNDPDSYPNNGNVNEDDYASVAIYISHVNAGGNVGGGNNLSNWTQVGNVGFNQIVWSLTNDLSGNLLIGTVGGKIFRTTDNGVTFDLINANMNVGFIWSLMVNNDGSIYAGTEQGLFKSTNNGMTWQSTSLTGADVRAIAKDNSGNIYAGLFGQGIYKSTNNGNTWTLVNNGLTSLAVQSITITPSNEIFVGTFGGGVYSSLDGGNSWNQKPIGYNYVWALTSSSNGIIYAGTYGNGVYRSTDNGNTWIKSSSYPANYVYALSVDGNGNLYASSWEAGVFSTNINSNSWQPIGLGGFGVSSIMVNSMSNAVFAGTSNGLVLRLSDAPQSVNNNFELPNEFKLEQNYPNPFNPVTTIKFSLPKDGFVKLSVYDILGREVSSIVNEFKSAGNYSVNFDAANLASGVYFYKIEVNGFSDIKKMTIIK